MRALTLLAAISFTTAWPLPQRATAQPTAPLPAEKAELEELRNQVQQLKDAKDPLWFKLLSPGIAFAAAIIAIVIPYRIFFYHARSIRDDERDKERRARAVELLNQFMTDEFYIKARLIIQEYLLPNGSKYRFSLNEQERELDFVRVGIKLGAMKEREHQEARFYIRAIPSFFWLIDQARNKGYLDSNESAFAVHYAWYWVHIIQHRIKGCEDDTMFRKIDWLLKPEQEAKVTAEYNRLLAALPQGVYHGSAASPPKSANVAGGS